MLYLFKLLFCVCVVLCCSLCAVVMLSFCRCDKEVGWTLEAHLESCAMMASSAPTRSDWCIVALDKLFLPQS
jgi:hypothetical protein